MQGVRFLLPAALLAALAAAFPGAPAAAETREAYLERLREICSVECKHPRDALRSARRNGRGASEDVALILDVGEVTMWNGKYMLHGLQADAIANPALGSRTPTQFRPVTAPNTIVVKLDEDTFFALLDVPTPREQAAMLASGETTDGILVDRDRRRNFTRPTLGQLRSTFRNRRVVVRGQPRLEVAFVGARREHRRKKLFVEVDNADHVAFLPRYDSKGEPIFDGPLEGLREAYLPAAP